MVERRREGVKELNQPKALVVATGELVQLRKDTSSLTEALGASIKTVPSTERALSYLEKSLKTNRPPGFIIVGLNNPGEITGLEFVKQVRSHDGLSCVPVIVLTSSLKDVSPRLRIDLMKQDATTIGRESFYRFIRFKFNWLDFQ